MLFPQLWVLAPLVAMALAGAEEGATPVSAEQCADAGTGEQVVMAAQKQPAGPFMVSPEDLQASLGAIYELTQAVFRAQCIYTVVRLGIPDIIGTGTLTVAEISARLPEKPNSDGLLRVLRNLASVGALIETATSDGDFAYTLTPITATLQKKAPQPSLAPMLEHWMEKPSWGALGELPDFVAGKTSSFPYEAHHGVNMFDFYRQNPDSAKTFSNFMDFNSNHEREVVLTNGPWEQYKGKTLLEIGGGLGRTMTAVAEKFPEVTCISFDLAEVIDQVKEAPAKITLAKGDMFKPETIPKCDVIFMKHILHDWDDEASVKILKSCYEVLPPNGEVVIVDAVLPGPGEVTPGSTYVDIWMMVIGGVERMQSQWEKLARESNFKLKGIQKTTMLPVSFITFSK